MAGIIWLDGKASIMFGWKPGIDKSHNGNQEK